MTCVCVCACACARRAREPVHVHELYRVRASGQLSHARVQYTCMHARSPVHVHVRVCVRPPACMRVRARVPVRVD